MQSKLKEILKNFHEKIPDSEHYHNSLQILEFNVEAKAKILENKWKS